VSLFTMYLIIHILSLETLLELANLKFDATHVKCVNYMFATIFSSAISHEIMKNQIYIVSQKKFNL